MTRTIGFIGAGNMAEAMIRGLLRGNDFAPENISASGPREERVRELSEKYGIGATTDNKVPAGAEIVVLSVKPQIMGRVLAEVGETISSESLVISIAAGVPVATIQARLASGTRVIRAMPNTPALVDAAATAIAGGEHARESDLADAKKIFDAIGLTVILEESLMDAVTGLSGSGPAYVFLILEALSDAGVKVGLSRRTAQLLAAQTVLGSAKLLLETNEHPGRLKDMVTSPGGTAITGLHTLENGGVRTTLMNAVEAATRRSRELGEAMREKEGRYGVNSYAMDALEDVEKELNEATRRAWTLIQSTDARHFTVRPHPGSWSAAECLSHLSISSESFLPVLRAALDDGRKRNLTSKRQPKMDLLGRILRWFLEPPIRAKTKTSAPFVPRAVRAKADAFGEFASLQSKLTEMLNAAHGLDLNKLKIVSPFDKRVKYNVFSAFRIVVAHQRRHLWQAEQAVAALRR